LLESAKKGEFKAFDLWPYADFIQSYGLDELELSLSAMEQLTPLFTCEFAVRPFLKKFNKETFEFLLRCAESDNEHVRRFASEGSRPRLPWGERLHESVRDPSMGLKVLERLRFDESLYVRKSVANHLNDIAKDHPLVVIKTLKRWQKEARGESALKKIDWIIQRALRTLIKEGHAQALDLIGVKTRAQVVCSGLKLSKKKIVTGERIEFEFNLRSLALKKQKIVVDYVVYFVKANGELSPKVFKLKTFELRAKELVKIKKSHHFKPITTKRYYPGKHRLSIQVNGQECLSSYWHLLEV
jgi:3-methyladenine DNA glycosylase AlkC